MKRFVLAIAALVLAFNAAYAVPAMRGVKKTITLSDGSKYVAELVGDENAHYYRTADGRGLQLKEGKWQFVNVDSLKALGAQRLAEKNLARRNRARLPEVNPNNFKGTKRGLVILVQFYGGPDFIYGKNEFLDYFNKVGYNKDGMGGSVHDYFLEQSYGQFDLEFDVVGPYTMPRGLAYYTANNDRNVGEMVKTAVKNADAEVNYKDYDWDNDGFVDQVYVIYQGYGEAQGAENTIWPHEFNLVSSTGSTYISQDGVAVNTYACSSELHGNGIDDTGLIDGIGTACHEFSHCLGIPDFYDTNGSNWGMDVWDLMDYGCYNGNYGYVPCGYTSYERMYSGWLTPIELTSAQRICNMPCLTDSPTAYIIYNKANRDEFYLLENHQRKGFDSEIFGHGMIVLHVDYSKSVWDKNQVNITKSRQRMSIIAADNTYDGAGATASSDPFPGTDNVTALTDETTPAADLNTKNSDGTFLMHAPITNIDEAGGLISFDFNGGKATIGTPVANEAQNVSDKESGFTADWTSVSGAKEYQVHITRATEKKPWENLMLSENFQNCYTKISGTTKDIGSNLDEYLETKGWTGEYLYRSPYMLRVGKPGAIGWIKSPLIKAPSSGTVTFTIGVVAVGTSDTDATFTLFNASGASLGDATLNGIPSAAMAGAGNYAFYTFNVPAWSYGDFRIGLENVANKANCYVGFIGVFDGEYSYDDLKNIHSLHSSDNILSNISVGDFELSSGFASCEPTSFVLSEEAKKSKRKASLVVEDAGLVTTSQTNYTFSGLQPGMYSYRVRAVDSDGSVGYWSNVVNVDLRNAATYIDNVRVDSPMTTDGIVFDLSGRRVNDVSKGIYIKNGKKILR